jgi:hypothetical protein
MSKGKTPTEDFVYDLARHSFLSLWSYINPQGKDPGKELCDVLVVCDPDVIIISVKEIEVKPSGSMLLDWQRWLRRAIEDSARQIYGAERWIRSSRRVIRNDGSEGLPFPENSVMRVHRVAIALGGKREMPIQFGNFGKGSVHVFDEVSMMAILGELDTISDFVEYLVKKETYCSGGKEIDFEGAEEDLMACYLHAGRRFPDDRDRIVVGEGIWEKFMSKPECIARKEADRDSYAWDKLIEYLCQARPGVLPDFGPTETGDEIVLRTMAREDRFSRRIIGETFKEFIIRAREKRNIRSRMCLSRTGVVYVFLAVRHGEKDVHQELLMRCHVARGLHKENKTVVGIAVEDFEPGKGMMSTLAFYEKKSWSDDDEKHMSEIQKNLGYFSSPEVTESHHDEYPVP